MKKRGVHTFLRAYWGRLVAVVYTAGTIAHIMRRAPRRVDFGTIVCRHVSPLLP